jgi:hypothetical protein
LIEQRSKWSGRKISIEAEITVQTAVKRVEKSRHAQLIL